MTPITTTTVHLILVRQEELVSQATIVLLVSLVSLDFASSSTWAQLVQPTLSAEDSTPSVFLELVTLREFLEILVLPLDNVFPDLALELV